MPTCSGRPPATGVRLAGTDLIIEVEKDFTTYRDEVKFGGGKVIRDVQLVPFAGKRATVFAER